MSFSAVTKNELARVTCEQGCCKLAELSALAKLDGSIQISGRQVSLKIVNENAAVARKVFTLLRELFDVQTEVQAEKKIKLRKNNVYMVQVSFQPKTMEILTILGLLNKRGNFGQGIKSEFIRRDCCRRSYLRGAFLGGGSISSPEAAYHLEIITTNEVHAGDIAVLIRRFGLAAKISRRKNWYVVYLKESEQIVNFLSIIGAHTALLEFENARIYKDMRNQVNRLVNCETANLNKTVDAALRQLESIEFVARHIGLERLPASLRQVAEARLAHPDISLRELGDIMNPRLGKSGINHRMRRIEEIAEKLRKHRGNSVQNKS